MKEKMEKRKERKEGRNGGGRKEEWYWGGMNEGKIEGTEKGRKKERDRMEGREKG